MLYGVQFPWKISPDSTSIQFDRVVATPGVLSGNTVLRKTMKERLNGTGLRYACWGSSTVSNDSTQGVLAGAVTSYAEATSGIFWNLNARGADWTCVWNGAVAGSGTSTIYTKIVTDWNAVAPLIDFAVFQPFANNLSNPADNMVSAKDYAGRAIQYMIRSGKPVVLVMPFCPSSLNVPHSKYQDAQAWLYAYAATYSLYPGQIQIWDLYQTLSNGVDVPQAWMAGDQTPRIHLNGVGAYYAAQAQTATNIVNNFGGFGYNTDPYGTQTPVGQLAAGTDTVSGCTVTAAANAPDGRLQWNIIPSASLSYVRSAAITVSTSKVYRMWMDYDLVSKTDGIEQYVDGAKCPNGAASMRDGIYVNSSGGSINYSARQLGRVRKFSHPFTPASTSVTIDIFPGGAGWQLLFRSLALFEYTP